VNYPRAIELFQEVIDNYPYSEYATLAELKIADVYFDQERYDEAASYYQDFVELHPTHAQVPYSLYRHGLCSSERIDTADRDQSSTHDAVEQFQALLDGYPDSEYAADARARLREASDMLARHDVEVGDFYLGRHECHSAARRYRQALSAYPEHEGYHRTMYQLARALVCARRVDDAIVIYRSIRARDPRGGRPGRVNPSRPRDSQPATSSASLSRAPGRASTSVPPAWAKSARPPPEPPTKAAISLMRSPAR
jgi:outer membrane protein assembly factor BamD